MKKFLTVILALAYMATSTGAAFQMHYCMGKLVDWDLGHKTSKTCGNCGMAKSGEKDNGCCKDEQKFVKNNTDQKTVETAFQLVQLIAVALPVSFVEISANDFPSVIEENPVNHAPPPGCGIAVYLRNCVFLI
jgi:hypothetical protein